MVTRKNTFGSDNRMQHRSRFSYLNCATIEQELEGGEGIRRKNFEDKRRGKKASLKRSIFRNNNQIVKFILYCTPKVKLRRDRAATVTAFWIT